MIISIITAFYKGNKYINQLLSCIKANAINLTEEIEIELVLINDSPGYSIIYDNSLVIGFTLKIITNKNNEGIQQARINGIKNCSGDYIIILDQDDMLSEYAIISQYKELGLNDVIVANGYNQQKCGNFDRIYKNYLHHLLTKHLKSYVYYGNLIVSPGQCMIKKNSMPKLWLNNPLKINGADDTLLWIMMLGKKCSFSINKELLYIHSYTGENLSLDIEKMAKSSLEASNLLGTCEFISRHIKTAFFRRNLMKLSYFKESINNKIIMLLKNIDITIYVIVIKLLRKIYFSSYEDRLKNITKLQKNFKYKYYI